MNTKTPLFFIPILCLFIIINIFSNENSQEFIPKESLIQYLTRENALATDSMTTEKNKDIKQNWRKRSLAFFLLNRCIINNDCITKEFVMQSFQQTANFLDKQTYEDIEKSLLKKIDELI